MNTKYSFIPLIYLALLFFVINLYFSQKISPAYFQLMNGDRKATVFFLQRIEKQPSFSSFLGTAFVNFDREIKNEIYTDRLNKEKTVKQLTELLKKNPKARDVLYRLFLINKELGEDQTANKYLKMAQLIDPDIKQPK